MVRVTNNVVKMNDDFYTWTNVFGEDDFFFNGFGEAEKFGNFLTIFHFLELEEVALPLELENHLPFIEESYFLFG